MKAVKLKSRYFVFLFLALLIVINIWGSLRLFNIDEIDDIDDIAGIEIVDIDFHALEDSVAKEGISYVFFYYEDSAFSDRMEANLKQFLQQGVEHTSFYKLNLTKYLGNLDKYDYTLLKDPQPYIHIYHNSKKVEQIAGIVPAFNLQIIHQRILWDPFSANN